MKRVLSKKWLPILLCCLLAGVSSAVTTISTSTVSGLWNDAARWSAGVPQQQDDAVLATPVNAATQISGITAQARSLVLSNGNSNASVQILNGGSLTLYGTAQIAGKGSISGRAGSLTIAQTNAAVAGTILNAAAIDVFSFTVSANSGTAQITINSNQSFNALNAVLGNGGAGAGGRLTLAGGSLVLSQWLTLGNDGTDSGIFVLNGGELSARFGIRAGKTVPPFAAEFIFNDGRIASANMEAFIMGLYPYVLEIELAGTGTHEVYAAAGASITMDATARFVDKPGENGTLLKTGPAVLTLGGMNSYSGGTTVGGGTLAVQADGGLGTGDVHVESASLSLGGGATDDYIDDNAMLVLQDGQSGLYLGYAGTDTVYAVSLDGGTSWLAAGVYDAVALDVMGTGFYYGTGYLNVIATPGPVAVPPPESGIWDMTAMRTNPVGMTVVSSSVSDGYINQEVHFFVTNTAGTVDRFYCCVERPQQIDGPLPLVFMLHGGSGHASPSLAKVPLNNLPVGQKAITIAIDYGTNHDTPELQALHTLYGAPVPQGYSDAADINEEILYRDMMGFRRILDYMLEQGDVDTNKVAVFGTSWGGFRTMLWAGLDNRIAVATTSPGAGGMRNSASAIGSQVAAIPEPMRERWYSEFDPLSHAGQVAARVFLEAPANDWYFWLGGVQNNLKAVPSDKRWLIVPNNTHGLGAPDSVVGGVTMPFTMNTLFGGPAWPEVDEDSLNAWGLSYEWQLKSGSAASATLDFSPGSTAAGMDWPSRYWVKIPAVFSNGKWSATLPDRFFEVAGEVFVSVIDTNGFKTSSLIQTRGGRNPSTTRCPLWSGENIWDIQSQENSWRPIYFNDAVIEKGTAAGSVKITPVANGLLSVCNNSVVLAAPYASTRQGLKLVLNGNGSAGAIKVELHKKSQIPAAEIYTANTSVGAGDTEVVLPWSAFVPQGAASGNPYPFDGLAITGTRAGNAPLTIQSIDFYEPKTTTGVPYWWLIENGFSGDMEAAALSDDDADGAQAWQEYFAGTDPLLGESVFRLSIEMKPEQQALLKWNPVFAGRNYTVESANDLRDGFSAEAPPMPYPAAAYTASTSGAQQFYRVAVDYTGTVRSASSYLPPGVAVLNPDGNGMRMVHYNAAGELVDLRAFGVNWYDAFSRYMEDVNDRSFVEGFDYLAAHGIPVARVHTRGYAPIGWDLYFADKPEYYRRLDDFVEQAEQHGIGLLLDLCGGLDIGELVDDAVAAGYLVPGVDFNPPSPLNRDIYGAATYAEYRTALGREDSGSNAFVDYYTRELAARYKDSPAVWGWEFVNEANNAVDLPNAANYRPVPIPALGYLLERDDATVPAWTSKDDITREHVRVAKMNFARAIRSVDSWRFITSGDSRPRRTAYNNWQFHTWNVDTRAEIVQVLPMDNPTPINTVSMHIYQPTDPYFLDDPVYIGPVTGDYAAFLSFFKQQSDLLGQPLFVGEWGAPGDGTTTDEKTTFHRFMQALIDTDVPLSLLWNFDNRNTGQIDSFWVNPGTPKEYQLTNDDPALWDLEQANQTYGQW
ncbi:MAG: cellulase family glycosylhydrolase [Kiritimatiellales bacterium]|nr:cellulase family glycosylhydrolase [Kiritimatiellales bacterium]